MRSQSTPDVTISYQACTFLLMIEHLHVIELSKVKYIG